MGRLLAWITDCLGLLPRRKIFLAALIIFVCTYLFIYNIGFGQKSIQFISILSKLSRPVGNPSVAFKPLGMYRGNATSLPTSAVIIPHVLRGTADQLFKYAFAYSIARKLNTILLIGVQKKDLDRNRKFETWSRSFALDYFKLNSSMVQYLSDPDVFIKSIPKEKQYSQFVQNGSWSLHNLPKDKIILIHDKAWHSEIYFEDYRSELTEQFVLRNTTGIPQTLLHDIETSESVGVHIRRGDFGGLSLSLPIEYQLRAVEVMNHLLKGRQLVKHFLFSDDIGYVKRAFNNSVEFTYVTNPTALNSLHELHLMSLCKHNIISNSGFSWWAAYVNKNPVKIVIAPFPKYRSIFYQKYGIGRKFKKWLYWNHTYPKEWIGLNPFSSLEDSL